MLIGILNLVILVQLIQLFRQLRQRNITDAQMDELIESRGLVMRFVRPLFQFIQKSWHIFPLGFLFGLGFDTASEVSLLHYQRGSATYCTVFRDYRVTYIVCGRDEFVRHIGWGIDDKRVSLGI